MPGIDDKLREHCRVVGRVRGVALGVLVDALRFEGVRVLKELELADDRWGGRIPDVHQSHPTPRRAERRTGKRAVDLVDVHLEGPAGYRNGRVALGAPERCPACAMISRPPDRTVRDRGQELVIER